MENIKMWKEDKRLVIVIENVSESAEEILAKMVGTIVSCANTDLEGAKVDCGVPVIQNPVYDNAKNKQGEFLYTPKGKIYLSDIKDRPDERDVLMSAITSTTTKNSVSLNAFHQRLRTLMLEYYKKAGDIKKAVKRYPKYAWLCLRDYAEEYFAANLDEMLALEAEKIRELLIKRLS